VIPCSSPLVPSLPLPGALECAPVPPPFLSVHYHFRSCLAFFVAFALLFPTLDVSFTSFAVISHFTFSSHFTYSFGFLPHICSSVAFPTALVFVALFHISVAISGFLPWVPYPFLPSLFVPISAGVPSPFPFFRFGSFWFLYISVRWTFHVHVSAGFRFILVLVSFLVPYFTFSHAISLSRLRFLYFTFLFLWCPFVPRSFPFPSFSLSFTFISSFDSFSPCLCLGRHPLAPLACRRRRPHCLCRLFLVYRGVKACLWLGALAASSLRRRRRQRRQQHAASAKAVAAAVVSDIKHRSGGDNDVAAMLTTKSVAAWRGGASAFCGGFVYQSSSSLFGICPQRKSVYRNS